MAKLIQLCFENFGAAMFTIAMLITLFTYKKSSLPPFENLLRWVCLLAIGVNGLYNFAMHGFFGAMTAAVIGWPNSPFQWEVAVANLGFGLLGLLSFKASFDFRKATIIANTGWLWGDAAGHIYQMVVHDNFTAGNAGSWFWLDVFIPLVLIICMAKMMENRHSV